MALFVGWAICKLGEEAQGNCRHREGGRGEPGTQNLPVLALLKPDSVIVGWTSYLNNSAREPACVMEFLGYGWTTVVKDVWAQEMFVGAAKEQQGWLRIILKMFITLVLWKKSGFFLGGGGGFFCFLGRGGVTHVRYTESLVGRFLFVFNSKELVSAVKTASNFRWLMWDIRSHQWEDPCLFASDSKELFSVVKTASIFFLLMIFFV